ncbi:hypothetical protein FB451DRAFT_1196519 [Mycena latifolia]|nr:hypothetical protein FB451DRAFT_1196519 [Mycena latifolia]
MHGPRIRNPPPNSESESDSTLDIRFCAQDSTVLGSRLLRASGVDWIAADTDEVARLGSAERPTPLAPSTSQRQTGIRAPADSEGVQTAVRLRGWLGWHQGQRQQQR